MQPSEGAGFLFASEAVECGSGKRVSIEVYAGEQDSVNIVQSQCGPKDARVDVEHQNPRSLRTYSCHEEYWPITVSRAFPEQGIMS